MVNMADRSHERARQDYVKAIYQLGNTGPVRAADLARHLGVTRASVSKFKRMLARDGLLHPSHHRTDELRLTNTGVALALRMVRRHRLIETFLHTTLRVPLERVHSEAERIEHAISDDVSRRLEGFLDHPLTDPHGHRIPHGTRDKDQNAEVPLTSIPAGQTIVISSIDDRRAATVRRLAALGVLPGLRARVVRNSSAGVHVVAKKRSIAIPADSAAAARCVFARSRKAVA